MRWSEIRGRFLKHSLIYLDGVAGLLSVIVAFILIILITWGLSAGLSYLLSLASSIALLDNILSNVGTILVVVFILSVGGIVLYLPYFIGKEL